MWIIGLSSREGGTLYMRDCLHLNWRCANIFAGRYASSTPVGLNWLGVGPKTIVYEMGK